MKMKYGHIIIMAMLIGTACSHDSSESGPDVEVPVVETRTAITFSGMQEEGRMVDQGTRANRRAGTPLSASAHRFKVWGDKNMTVSQQGVFDEDGTTMQTVFPGYIVNWLSGSSSASNSNGWEYVAQQDGGYEQTIKYWDWSAKAYRYFAVTGTNTDYTDFAEPGTYESSYKTVHFTMTADCSTDEKASATPFYSHLWFSTGQLPTYTDKQFGKAVLLEFLKPFARVRFMFNYAYAAEAVKLTNPSFKPTDDSKIARKGTFTVTYPLTGTATSEWYAATKNNAPAENEELDAFTEEYIPEGTEKWYLVLPVDTQDSYTMTVTVNNVEKTAVVPGEYMTWKPGYSYTYIFKITDDGGVAIDLVQTAVTPWTDMETTHTVYNW